MGRKLILVNPVNPARTGLTVNKSSRHTRMALLAGPPQIVSEGAGPLRYIR
jgi:hypothetical protein